MASHGSRVGAQPGVDGVNRPGYNDTPDKEPNMASPTMTRLPDGTLQVQWPESPRATYEVAQEVLEGLVESHNTLVRQSIEDKQTIGYLRAELARVGAQPGVDGVNRPGYNDALDKEPNKGATVTDPLTEDDIRAIESEAKTYYNVSDESVYLLLAEVRRLKALQGTTQMSNRQAALFAAVQAFAHLPRRPLDIANEYLEFLEG